MRLLVVTLLSSLPGLIAELGIRSCYVANKEVANGTTGVCYKYWRADSTVASYGQFSPDSALCPLHTNDTLIISDDFEDLDLDEAGQVLCCDFDYCNSADWIVLKFSFEFIESFLHGRIVYDVVFFIHIVAIFTFSLFPLVYYFYFHKKIETNFDFDVNPQISSETLQRADAFWPESMIVWEPVGTVTGQNSLQEVRKLIHTIERNSVLTCPSLGNTSRLATFGQLRTYHKGGTNMVMYRRLSQTKYEELLYQMIEHGPGHFSLRALEVTDMLNRAFNVLSSESSLLEISGPIAVFGDLRGQYCDLFRWLQIVGFPPKIRLLFLGGFYEGDQIGCIETLTFVAALKVVMPNHVFLLRGATEFVGVKVQRRFNRQVCNDLSNVARRLFSQMPLAAVINKSILCMHGGVSNRIRSLDDIRDIRRPITDVHCATIVHDLIFNLPDINVPGTKAIPDGHGRYFGAEVVEDVMARLELRFIVRAHTSSPEGYFFFCNRRMLTLWSATGRDSRYGAALVINEKMEMDLFRLRSSQPISYGCTPVEPDPTIVTGEP